MVAAESAPPPVTVVAHDIGPVGGMERQLSELIRGLLSAGGEVTVVSRTCELEPHERLRYVRVPGPARPFVLAYPWFFAAGSVATWRHRRGVLHTTGAIVFNKADVSTVHFCHHAPTARTLRRPSRATALHRVNDRFAAVASRLAERFVFRPSRTGEVVGVSAEVAGDLQAAFPRARVRMIANGVDADRFRPEASLRTSIRRELGIGDDLVALFVGSEWRGKGLDVAIAATREAGWRLVVVGDGDRTPYTDVPATEVLFVGRQEQTERYYAAADAFVFPSAHESAPLVVLEAAAAGLPLLVCDVGGLEGIVTDGVTGWRLERRPAEFAAKLRLLQDGAFRAQLGAAARAAAGGRSWDSVVDAYVELYEVAA